MCAMCARAAYRRATTKNLLLGWWSGPSLLINPILLFQNRKEMARVAGELAGQATPARGAQTGRAGSGAVAIGETDSSVGVESLPWSHLLGIEGPSAPGPGTNLGQRQLTPPMAIGALAALVLFVSLIAVVALSFTNGNNRPEEAATMRMMGWIGLVISVATLVGCVFWQRALGRRPDRAPDLLGSVIPQSLIFESGLAHVSALAFEIGGMLRLVAVVQNCFDGAGEVRLEVRQAKSHSSLQQPLTGSEVTLFVIDLPLPPATSPTGATARLGIAFNMHGGTGERIRFAPRTALRTPERAAATAVAMAAGGHVRFRMDSGAAGTLGFMDREGKIAVEVPTASGPASTAASAWRRVPLWTVEKPQTPAYAAKVFLKLLPAQKGRVS